MQECCIFLNAFSPPSTLTPPGPKRGVEDAAPYTQPYKGCRGEHCSPARVSRRSPPTGGYRIRPYGGLKPPLCKGRWHGVSRDGGIGARAGRLMYGQGHNPPPPIGGALRARAPLSLRDISPHCGESPFTQGGLCSMPTKWHLLRAGRWRASAPTERGRFGPGGVNAEGSGKALRKMQHSCIF